MDKGGQSQGGRGKEGPIEPPRPSAASSPAPPPLPQPCKKLGQAGRDELAACSPSLASTEIPGPPETRTSLSATAPRANGAGKPRRPVPAPGKRTAPGQLGEAGTRERWWEGEGAQTHRGRSNRLYAGTPSPDTPYLFFRSPLA
ncbi:PREDICTED: KH domain-containing, RNA-binding, signal transduction-associated protein 1-like [Bison bison bison]|uniref:KH domain-containing, RNA-binding, signal transduction-associated protein 1-like n=1 Tax=Bison bison bison TaxID=43346 RepID=A0A6P3HR88_BISBB|nr:PREDICTED: KH domain-containing, RNA-binding, signal transduction-associated protein 1-like [Bison bison bison]